MVSQEETFIFGKPTPALPPPPYPRYTPNKGAPAGCMHCLLPTQRRVTLPLCLVYQSLVFPYSSQIGRGGPCPVALRPPGLPDCPQVRQPTAVHPLGQDLSQAPQPPALGLFLPSAVCSSSCPGLTSQPRALADSVASRAWVSWLLPGFGVVLTPLSQGPAAGQATREVAGSCSGGS